EHVRERHHGVNDHGDTTRFLPLDLTAATVDVTDDRTNVLFRRHDLDLHDRLEELSTSLLRTLTECSTSCDFEGQNRGVDVVVSTIDQGRLHAEHREAGDRTRRENALYTLLDARDVFLRNGTTDDLGLEDEILTIRVRLEDDLDASELTRTTRLLLVGVVDFGNAGDRLTVRNLRSADIRLDLELATHMVDDDVEVKF